MRKKAFTLVELLVVVAIIAILATSIMVGLGRSRVRARDIRRINDIKSVQAALEVYYAKNNQYPAAADWATLRTVLNTAGVTSQLPNDPLTGSHPDYDYCDCDSQQRYILQATLEDSSNCPPDYTEPSTVGWTCNGGVLDCNCTNSRHVCFTMR